MLFLSFLLFFLVSGRLYFSHLFGIFAGSHNAATVQIAGDNDTDSDNDNFNSDNESCLES